MCSVHLVFISCLGRPFPPSPAHHTHSWELLTITRNPHSQEIRSLQMNQNNALALTAGGHYVEILSRSAIRDACNCAGFWEDLEMNKTHFRSFVQFTIQWLGRSAHKPLERGIWVSGHPSRDTSPCHFPLPIEPSSLLVHCCWNVSFPPAKVKSVGDGLQKNSVI